MREVPLLVAKIVFVSETGSIGAGGLESVVGIEFTVVIEVVIRGEALMVIDLMIEAERKLVGVDRPYGNDLILAGPDIGCRNELLKQIGGYWVLAGRWNHSAGKDRRPIRKTVRVSRQAGDGVAQGSVASGATIQHIGDKTGSLDTPCKGSLTGEVPGEFLGGGRSRRTGWDIQQLPWYSVTNPACFIRDKEEGAVFHDRTAEGAAELVLIELRLGGVRITA